MKTTILKISVLSSFAAVFAVSCMKEQKQFQADLIPVQDVFAENYIPVQQSKSSITFFNAISLDNNKAALGRVLFYDPRLSLSGAVSCASCHKQELGFADQTAFSMGIKGQGTTLNAIALSNLDNSSILFWENRAHDLESLSLMPVSNHIEMGFLNTGDVVRKISSIDLYQKYFKVAFGHDAEINSTNISKALAEFMLSLRSDHSKFDECYDGDITAPFSGFTALENEGKSLFFNKYQCMTCHGNISRISRGWDESMSNIGLPPTGSDLDTMLDKQVKVPSLRNVALSAPYMHDGRFNTLDQVLDHYSHGITMNSGLSWQMRTFVGNTTQPREFNISDSEKAALIAFLNTLTDVQFTSDRRLSNPFSN